MKKIIVFFLVANFILSCESKINQNPPEKKTQKVEVKKHVFKTNEEVEKMISQHKTFFMNSYWGGMTIEETQEVCRYNMDKNNIQLTINNYNERLSYPDLPEVSYEAKTTDILVPIDDFKAFIWNWIIETPQKRYIGRTFFGYDTRNGYNDELKFIRINLDVSDVREYHEIVKLYKSRYDLTENLKIHDDKTVYWDLYRFLPDRTGSGNVKVSESTSFRKNNINVWIIYENALCKDEHGKLDFIPKVFIYYSDQDYLKWLEEDWAKRRQSHKPKEGEFQKVNQL
jgi:hypothetical protein